MLEEAGVDIFDPLRWGLVPHWAKDKKIASKTINALVETVDTAPSYRSAFKKRRCLIPADGFYEWQKVGSTLKQSWSIGMADHAPLVFASLWEGWKKHRPEEWIHTCTIITGEPNEKIAEIHTPMPVILPSLDRLQVRKDFLNIVRLFLFRHGEASFYQKSHKQGGAGRTLVGRPRRAWKK